METVNSQTSTFKERCKSHFSNMLGILGDEVIITLSSTNEKIKVKCLFENLYYSVEDTIGDVEISSAKPRLVCNEDDVINVQKNDLVSIDDITYKVIELQNEGTGTVNIVLNKI